MRGAEHFAYRLMTGMTISALAARHVMRSKNSVAATKPNHAFAYFNDFTDLIRYMQTSAPTGAQVSQVEPGSPAAGAGIEDDDLVARVAAREAAAALGQLCRGGRCGPAAGPGRRRASAGPSPAAPCRLPAVNFAPSTFAQRWTARNSPGRRSIYATCEA